MERIGIDTLHKLFYGYPPNIGGIFCAHPRQTNRVMRGMGEWM